MPALVVLAVLIGVLMLAQLTSVLMQRMGNTMGSVPVIGKVIGSILSAVGSAIYWACNELVKGLGAMLGAVWHVFASTLDFFWRMLVQGATIQLQIAKDIANGAYSVTGLRAVVATLTREWHGIEHGVRTLERKFHGIEAQVKALEREVAGGIGHDLRLQIKALERDVATVENKLIPAVQGEVTTAEREITNLYEWAKGKASLLGIGTFAFAIASVIGADVFRLLRCNELGNLARKYRCGLWDLLGNLLALAGFLTLAFDFQEFVDAAEIVAEGIGEAVAKIEGTFATSLPPLPPPN